MIVRGIDVDRLVDVVEFFHCWGDCWVKEAGKLARGFNVRGASVAVGQARLADRYAAAVGDVVGFLTEEGLAELHRSGAAV